MCIELSVLREARKETTRRLRINVSYPNYVEPQRAQALPPAASMPGFMNFLAVSQVQLVLESSEDDEKQREHATAAIGPASVRFDQFIQ